MKIPHIYISVVLLSSLLLLVGCDTASLFSNRPMKAVFVEIPKIEFMEGGSMPVDISFQSYPGDDDSWIMYYEIYSGDTFLRSHIQKVEMNNRYRWFDSSEMLRLTKFSKGKHELTIKFWYSPAASDRSCKKLLKYTKAGKVNKHKYVCEYHQEFFERGVKSEVRYDMYKSMYSDFDTTKQWSRYFITGGLKTHVETRDYCIDYCTERVVDNIITQTEYVDRYINKNVYIEKDVYVEKELHPVDAFVVSIFTWIRSFLGW